MDRVVQYTCPTHRSTRVYPYSGHERDFRTEAPVLGASGEPVLLASLNNARRVRGEAPFAYCWECGDWVEAEGETRAHVAARYLARSGIRFRLTPGDRRTELARLRRAMEERDAEVRRARSNGASR